MIIHEIEEEKIEELVKGDVVLLDFFANWCGPCKMLAPELEELAKEENITIYKIDVDKYPDLARKYGVMSIPSMFLYKNDNLIGNKTGFLPKDSIKEWIKES